MKEYIHGGDIYRHPDVLDFSANINPLGTPPAVVQAAKDSMEWICHYPDQFADPNTKNAEDLVIYVTHAWESGWGYVWGTYGSVLTESLLDYKIEQYPDGVGTYETFIRANWLGGRTTDCVGLIKGYGWLNPDTMTIEYGTNGMPDLGANQMYYNASVSGTIDTMPDIPGLAVWHDGHIGVYIGDGYVIEAMNTKKGVVKTKLEGRGWTHWLQIEYINYD